MAAPTEQKPVQICKCACKCKCQCLFSQHQAATAELCKQFPNLHMLEPTPHVIRLFTIIRDAQCCMEDFVFHSDEITRLLISKALDMLPYQEKVVVTPTDATFQGLELVKKPIGVTVIRAGDSMIGAFRSLVKPGRIGKILIQRDEARPDKPARLFYTKLPADIKDHCVFVLDPMLATGGSVCMAIRVLLDAGVREEDITFVNLVAAPEGMRNVFRLYPKVKVVCGMVDPKLNEQMYIVPGLGDFGDRYYGAP